jgi:phenylalanyl-tRNA synthetase alpha chain
MNTRHLAERLHENERKLLMELKTKSSSETEELSRLTGLERDAVEKASLWASAKGVVAFKEQISRSFVTSQEGQRYAEQGLPEMRLIKLVSMGVKKIEDLKEELDDIDIAIVWVIRKKWGSIESGIINLNKNGLKALKEEPYEEILLTKMITKPLKESQLKNDVKKVIDILLKRGLVEEDKKTQRWINLTDLGRQVIPYIEDAPMILTQLTPEILKSGEWKNAHFQYYDIKLPVPSSFPGKRHFISQVIDYIRRFWIELGFQEMKGNYLELCFWNFDALFQPQDHPARDLADTFYMKIPEKGRLPDKELVNFVKETHENGWTTGSIGWQYKWNSTLARRNCLRTHTTSLSVNQLALLKPDDLPAKFFSVGRVFRNETIDWNHLIEFYQTDGIVVGEGVTFRNLQGYLKAYLEGLGLKKFRFRPGYFPYTEMSLEAEVWIEERGEWMELFGAGIFRPEVVKPLLGIDVPVLAWGPGFDRLVMQQYHLDNIKELYSNDIGFLREAKLWMG